MAWSEFQVILISRKGPNIIVKEVEMNLLSFALYYSKLQLTVAFGLYRTSLPMNIRWRWNFWLSRRESMRVRKPAF